MADDPKHASPHDTQADEPLGPATPDDESAAGDTPEVHDSITPHDLPKDHPGRPEAVDDVGKDGALEGNT